MQEPTTTPTTTNQCTNDGSFLSTYFNTNYLRRGSFVSGLFSQKFGSANNNNNNDNNNSNSIDNMNDSNLNNNNTICNNNLNSNANNNNNDNDNITTTTTANTNNLINKNSNNVTISKIGGASALPVMLCGFLQNELLTQQQNDQFAFFTHQNNYGYVNLQQHNNTTTTTNTFSA